MSKLDELPAYRETLMKEICSNVDIVKLITNVDNPTVPNKNVLYKNVFPYKFKPSTTTNADTFITTSVSGDYINKTLKSMDITFYIFTDESLLRTKNGLRTDLIAKAMEQIFNGYTGIALGKMNFLEFQDFDLSNSTYHGIIMNYTIDDWNNPTMKKGF